MDSREKLPSLARPQIALAPYPSVPSPCHLVQQPRRGHHRALERAIKNICDPHAGCQTLRISFLWCSAFMSSESADRVCRSAIVLILQILNTLVRRFPRLREIHTLPTPFLHDRSWRHALFAQCDTIAPCSARKLYSAQDRSSLNIRNGKMIRNCERCLHI